MDNLFLIPSAKYTFLEEVLLKRLPSSAMLLNILQLQNTQRFSEKVDIKFYATTEHLDNLEQGASVNRDEGPIIIAHGVFEYILHNRCILFSLPTLSDKCYARLSAALDALVDWKWPNLLGDVPDEITPKLIEWYKRKPGKGHKYEPEYCRYYWMDIQEALQLAGHDKMSPVTIRPLCISDAAIVNNHWVEQEEGTLQLITESIDKIGSAGVFVNEELASWVVTTQLGSINALHTKESHRRRGYGEMALREIVRHNGRTGLRSVAHVRVENSVSQQLMEKVGLQYARSTTWLQMGPLNEQ